MVDTSSGRRQDLAKVKSGQGQTDLKYIGQRAGRGLANIVGGLPDMASMVANAGLRDVGYFAGYKPDDVFQFPSTSDTTADIATNATGAEIVKPEEATRGARLMGQGVGMGTEVLADPSTYATAGLSKLAPLAGKYGPQLLKAAEHYGPEAATAVKAMFLGPSSPLFRKDMAKVAEEMKAAGATRDEIWRATGTDQIAGTMHGPRGEPMQEISDKGARFKDPAEYVDKAPDFTAGDVFHHPQGFEAYPDLGKVEFNWRNMPSSQHGSFSRGYPELNIPDTAEVGLHAPDKASTMLHETFTHGVQNREGWPKGGNTFALNPGTPAWDIYKEKMKAVSTPMSREAFEASSFHEPGAFTYDDYVKQTQDALKNPVHARMLDRVVQEEAVNEAYHRSTGEVQPRNVQARKDMTLEERKAKPPWETQDVPTDQQIPMYRDDHNVQQSILRQPQRLEDYPGDPAQVTAKGKDPEAFHGVGGGNKIAFSDLTSTKVPTEGSAMLPDKPFNPEDFKLGSWLLPLYGDKTIAGQTLLDVNGRPLKTPQKLGGGGRYMQENPDKLWASGQGKATKVGKTVRELEQESGERVYGTHVSMGAPGSDFAKMTARTLLQTTDQANIGDDAARAFDALMAKEGVTNWPGIKNVDTEEWLSTAGANRATLAKVMAQSKFMNDPAFGHVGGVRKAITEPELMHQPMLTSGMTVGQFAPGGQSAPGSHEDYGTDWLGQHLGNMGQVPYSVMFNDPYTAYMAKHANNPKAQQLPTVGYTVERAMPAQKITPQWQDQAMDWWTRRNDQ